MAPDGPEAECGYPLIRQEERNDCDGRRVSGEIFGEGVGDGADFAAIPPGAQVFRYDPFEII